MDERKDTVLQSTGKSVFPSEGTGYGNAKPVTSMKCQMD